MTYLVIYTHVRTTHVRLYSEGCIPDFKPDCVTFRHEAIQILFPITEALDPTAD